MQTLESLEKMMGESPCNETEVTSGFLQVVFGTKRLVIQSAWRIVRGDEIIVASDSNADGFDTGAAALCNTTVDRVEVSAPFHDIEVRFSNGILLQSFADSETYEHWYFFRAPNDMIIAGPSELWSVFSPSD